jgi:ketosteroid isomerase-like protein
MTADERTVRELFAALDAGDAPRALSLLTDDVRFQFGSTEPVVGHEGVAGNGAAMATTVASLSHDLHTVWAVDEAVICEMAVTYARHDGSRLTLPCLNVFGLREGRFADYRISMDVNPVFVP